MFPLDSPWHRLRPARHPPIARPPGRRAGHRTRPANRRPARRLGTSARRRPDWPSTARNRDLAGALDAGGREGDRACDQGGERGRPELAPSVDRSDLRGRAYIELTVKPTTSVTSIVSFV